MNGEMSIISNSLSRGGVMKKDYTAAEDIRDVLQLVSLINQRPCITKHAERGTTISYRELFAIKARLEHALTVIEAPKEIVGAKDWTNGEPSKRLTRMESRIVTRLYVRKSITTSQLASELNLSPSAMLEALQVMQGLGVIESNVPTELENHLTSWRLVADSSGIGADDDRNRSL